MKGNKKFEPPRFMTVSQAAQQLMEIVESKSTVLQGDTLCVGVARVGWPDQKIAACTLKEMQTRDIGTPLHSLVIVGKAHPLELDYLKMMDPDFSCETAESK